MNLGEPVRIFTAEPLWLPAPLQQPSPAVPIEPIQEPKPVLVPVGELEKVGV